MATNIKRDETSDRRGAWANLSDALLLRQCDVDTYRASGPGGQKRNKTSSAVRLRHLPSGLIVIAEESRSQHENKSRALKRLRQGLYLQIRNNLKSTAEVLKGRPDYQECFGTTKRLNLGRRDPRFWPAVGLVLDVLQATEARVKDAASLLGINTANLVEFLQSEPRVWQQANRLRTGFGRKPLVS